MTATVHNFKAQLAASQTPEVDAMVRKVMFEMFAGELLAMYASHPENDRLGSDYILEFRGGKIEHLDVKVRTKDYYPKPNTPIEYQTGNKDGWAIDTSKITDWVLFLWLDTGRSSLHNGRMLRIVARKNQDKWKASCQQSTQQGDDGYSSSCLYLADRDLWAAEYMHFAYPATTPLKRVAQATRCVSSLTKQPERS